MLPKDPIMLMSTLNTYLRDRYPSLEALCEDLDLDRAALEEKLAACGFQYDAAQKRFR